MISLQILHKGNAAKAGHYYADQKDDYYSRDGNSAQWQGQGAELVGLTGEVAPAQFVAAMRGDFGPDVQLSRSIRKDAKARAAMDVTFSAPKSVSIQALVGKDATVLAAHDHAVTKTLEFLEKELIRARQKENGETRTEKTANAIMAKFRHETARPTDFDEADPQLHTHTLVMNVTQRADGAWVSVSNEEIYRAKRMLDAIYKNEMATYLEKAGYALRYEKDNFELAHISREHIEQFSKRGMTVQAELAKMGKTRKTASRELKQTITLATRNEKRPEITRDALNAGWQRQALELDIDFGAARKNVGFERGDRAIVDRGTPGAGRARGSGRNPRDLGPVAPEDRHGPDRDRRYPGPRDAGEPLVPSQAPNGQGREVIQRLRGRIAEECVDWAIRHIAERESVMTEKQILEAAMEHAMGAGATFWELKQAIHAAVARGHLVQGAPVYRSNLLQSNEITLSREAWIQRMVHEGATLDEARRNVRRAIAMGGLVLDDTRYTTQAAREREKRILQIEREGRGKMPAVLSQEAAHRALSNKGLKPGQLAAAQLIVTSADRIVGVQGLAGVGKSHMLKYVKEATQGTDYTVRSIAPYGSQVKALRVVGVEAVTVASMLQAHTNRFELDKNTVLVVDEAGVVPTRQMEQIMRRAEKAGARVVLLGDIAQTKAIEAGRPLHQLQDAGMQTAHMGDIVRQKNPVLKRAVELAAEGNASQALHVLQTKLQAVQEIKDSQARYERIADSYASLSVDEQRQTLIITGTNASRNAINNQVHAKLGLAGKGFDYALLTRIDTTQAQRRSAKYYQLGNVIQPERAYKNGLEPDAQYVVTAIDTGRNRIAVAHLVTGERIEFNPSRSTKLSVYDRVEAELSAGEVVRVTRNDARLDLVNGERYTVLAVTPGTVKLGRLDADGNILREVGLIGDLESHPLHLDRAYASTVHSAQGLSETGVILNQETFSRTTKSDVFYVAISREKEWIQVYTDDITKLPFAVSRTEEKSAALDIGIAAKVHQSVQGYEAGPTRPTPHTHTL
ncbi:MobF family relaxase [Pollutimonas bauzanensis]|uniref:Conjugative relaxase domain-containing protein, TrwC/TraI family n=1 Tax=Pollutimonas bauzanensis TaxID=658167 RepID=A0A1M5YIG6_9BURK|nr:MobF family relaxase [Pollutimonas bauzanensis]SHI11837.1 conjugative relaxase domain-containing protein, TrwC/TraI family [Pollutimonas bauzanensis]